MPDVKYVQHASDAARTWQFLVKNEHDLLYKLYDVTCASYTFVLVVKIGSDSYVHSEINVYQSICWSIVIQFAHYSYFFLCLCCI